MRLFGLRNREASSVLFHALNGVLHSAYLNVLLLLTPPEINDPKPCSASASIINLCWFLGNSDLQNVYLVHTEFMTCAHVVKSVAFWLLALWVNEQVLV